MMQSYSNDSITDMFLDFVKKIFKNDSKKYKLATSEKYVPASIIEEFKNEKESIVKSFTFKTKMLLGHLDNNTIGEKSEEFVITVKAESIKGIKKNKFEKWKEVITNSSVLFGNTNKPLHSFSNRNASIKNEKIKKSTSFELSTRFDIKPVIYLDESKIKFKGVRIIDFESLKDYCFKLLEEIEKDIYKI